MRFRLLPVVGLVLAALGLAACTGASSTYIQPSEPTVLVISVKAISATFGSSTDQVYLVTDAGERAPTGTPKSITMKSGDTWKPNFFVTMADARSISLMESDVVGDDDVIGIFSFSAQKPIGRYVEKMTGDGSNYEVTFEVKR